MQNIKLTLQRIHLSIRKHTKRHYPKSILPAFPFGLRSVQPVSILPFRLTGRCKRL